VCAVWELASLVLACLGAGWTMVVVVQEEGLKGGGGGRCGPGAGE